MQEQSFLGLIGLCAKAGQIVYGAQGCELSVKKNQAKLLILDNDVSENTCKAFTALCKNRQIPLICWQGTVQIGKRTGQPANKVFAVKNDVFAQALIRYYNEDTPGV